jgi:hypothetical protein
MPHSRIVVDGVTRLDTDLTLGRWQQAPPDVLADMIKPGARREPWSAAVLSALIDALVADQPVAIGVDTRNGDWTMTVRHRFAHNNVHIHR